MRAAVQPDRREGEGGGGLCLDYTTVSRQQRGKLY